MKIRLGVAYAMGHPNFIPKYGDSAFLSDVFSFIDDMWYVLGRGWYNIDNTRYEQQYKRLIRKHHPLHNPDLRPINAWFNNVVSVLFTDILLLKSHDHSVFYMRCVFDDV